MNTHFVNLLDDLLRRALRMANHVEDIVGQACEAIFDPDPDRPLRVIERDREIDAVEIQIEAEVIRLLALYQPVGRDLRLLCSILKSNSDLESIGDCAVNIAERARHLAVQRVARHCNEMSQLAPAVRRLLRCAVYAFGELDEAAAYRAIDDDAAVDALYAQIARNMVAGVDESTSDFAAHLDLLSIATNLERIADRAGTIGKNVIYVTSGQIVRHRNKLSLPA